MDKRIDSILKQPILIPIGKASASLLEVYRFNIAIDGELHTVQIDVGFSDYNGFSNPRWLWSVLGIGRFGWQNAASLVHDYIYVNKGVLIDINGVGITITRKMADRLLQHHLELLKYNKFQCDSVYRAVRLAGFKAWRD